jgi:hypothetical protein
MDKCPVCGKKLVVQPTTVKWSADGKKVVRGGKAWCPDGHYSETRLPK